MAKPVFIGDEVTAAGFRLAGLASETPPADGVDLALERARGEADLVLISAESAEALPQAKLNQALRMTETLMVIIPDINGEHVPDDMEKHIRGLLGIES
ncbi:MAG: hypothetical protein LJE67_09990 [Salaquimonas sp.]|nr:hypothetical protein [Salaquimonas sp.]